MPERKHYPKRMRWTVLLLVAGLALSSVTAPAATDLRAKDQSAAYVALIRADKARDAKDETRAQAAYRKALGMYRQLLKDYPGWHDDIFEYRTAYCQNQLAELQGTGGTTTPTPVAVVQDNTATDRSVALSKENAYLRQRIASMARELEESAGTDPIDSAELTRLNAENAKLRTQISEALASSDTAAEERLAVQQLRQELAAAKRNADDSRQDNEDLRDKVASLTKTGSRVGDLEQQVRVLKEENSELTKTRAKGDVEKEIAGHKQRSEALQKELAALKDSNKDLEKHRGSLEKQAAQYAEDNQDVTRSLEAAKEDAKQAASETRTLRDELKRVGNEYATLQKEHAHLAATTDSQTSSAAASEEEARMLRKDLDAARAERDTSLETVSAAEGEMARLRASLAEQAGSNKDLDDRIAATEQARADMEVAAKANRDSLAGQRRDLASLEKRYEELNRDRNLIGARAKADANLVLELRTQNRQVRTQFQRMESEAERLTRELAKMRSEVGELKTLRKERMALLSENRALDKELTALTRVSEERKRLLKALRDKDTEIQGLIGQ